MSGQFIYPNWHTILIHYPLGLLSIGILIEIFSFLWRRSSVRSAGRWMILLGVLASIPAAAAGLYAFRQTADPTSIPGEIPWYQAVQSSPWNAAQWDAITEHLEFAAFGTGLMILTVLVWIGCSDDGRRKLYWPALVALLAGFTLIIIGAWHGGEAVYQNAVAVRNPAAPLPPPVNLADKQDAIQYFLPPIQLHVVLAGFLISVIVAALALSMRRCAMDSEEWRAERAAVVAGQRPARSTPSNDPQCLGGPRVFPARFWLVAFFLALAVAAVGLWLIDIWDPRVLWTTLQQDRENEHWRNTLHAGLATLIILFTLFLAIVLRFMPRRRFAMGVFSTLLVITVIAQIGIGTLLLYDTGEGSIAHFNRPPHPATQPTTNATTQPAK